MIRTPRFLLTSLTVAALSVACFGQVSHALAETYPPPPVWHPVVQQREHLRRSITLMDQSTRQKRNTVKIVFYGQSITSAESQHWWKEVSRYLHATYPMALSRMEPGLLG
jgi:hypothetical protein